MSEVDKAVSGVNQFLASYLESQVDLWQSYVDPREAYLSSDGELWESIGAGGSPLEDMPFRTCAELFQIQSVSRYLCRENEFAINAITNRINYIIGEGHVYTVVGITPGVPIETTRRVQSVLDRILTENKWTERQREIQLRDDRDGETFIRKFLGEDGIMRFRFVEPRQVLPPPNAEPHQSFGVETLIDDIETPYAYWVDGDPVPCSEIQHRKWNVDSSMKRGYPLLYPVRKNLVRAVKLLRNMSTATEIQTAIALIRKHQQQTREAVRSFVSTRASESNSPGRPDNVLKYAAGSILDVPSGQEYTVPPQIDPSKTVSALQAELRAIASRLTMPEFMISADASNANYSSTMVAEGPAVKNFQAEQKSQKDSDLELINDAMSYAQQSGLVTEQDLRQTRIEVQAPTVQVRDQYKEAQTRQVDMGLGILSHQSATAQIGKDYDQEQLNIEKHSERSGAITGLGGEPGGGAMA
jgi:hypothetical protein